MKIKSILTFAAVMALSFAAHAHDCSGGAGGGMDATGNQCNDESAYSAALVSATPTASHATLSSSRHEQKVITGIKPVATSTASATPARSASQRVPKKHSQRATTKLKKDHATAG